VAGLKEGGIVLVNSADEPAKVKKSLKLEKGQVWTVPATEIALKILGAPIMNTAMLGVAARATSIVALESIEKTVKERFRADVAEKNFAVIKEAFKEGKQE
ncbi:MAG: 2-oxoacid:acceptor oxidoreductase family protein, partial [Candidatus Bathyarchaeia archaeon]